MVRRDRRTADGTRKVLDFRWDSDGRLREVSEAGQAPWGATYAADGERITKSDFASGAHIYSFGLHDTAGNTVHTQGTRSGRTAPTASSTKTSSAQRVTSRTGVARDFSINVFRNNRGNGSDRGRCILMQRAVDILD